jgi:hypothetical protein
MSDLAKRLRFDANDVRNHHSSTIADRILDAAVLIENYSLHIRKLEAQIAAAEGWKLVPVEPTAEMVVDGFESWPSRMFSEPEEWIAYEAMSGCQQAAHRARLCYAAMLAAAPTVACLAEQLTRD